MSSSIHLIDVRQTKEYATFLGCLGWQTIMADSCKIYVKKVPLLPFCVAKILRSPITPSFDKLKILKKKYRILFIKMAPFILDISQNTKYSLDSSPLTPTKTVWLNLTKTENQLLQEMQAKTRYNIRLSQRKNLQINIVPGNKISNQQLMNFYHLWAKTPPSTWWLKPSFKELQYLVSSFGEKCFFVFIYPLPMIHYPLASCLILTSPNVSFYWHNCSSPAGKRLFAPTLCVWEAIGESKKRGLKVFDLEGIYDERYGSFHKSWLGFTKFKRGFGGEEIKLTAPQLINLFPRRT
jgi:lipid II:glycine glycyltransferase (peptidoglycan interpeptide bridge formation enzyme)